MFVNKPPYRALRPRMIKYRPPEFITNISDYTHQAYVLKCGATTGITCGVTSVEYWQSHTRTPVQGSNNPPSQLETFFEEGCIITGMEDAPFSLPGDSGSWVVDTDGSLIGIIYGGLKSGLLVQTMFLPIKRVIRAVERKTNRRVGLPLPRSWLDAALGRWPVHFPDLSDPGRDPVTPDSTA